MLTFNVINPDKNSSDKITGINFFLFVASNTQATLFDADMGSPIVWGTKDKVSLIMSQKLPEIITAKSISIQIYKWSGGKFTFKSQKMVSNNTDEIKMFLRRQGI
jgi:hypothetical protein